MKYTPRPKRPKAIWTTAFPNQVRPSTKKPRVFKPRKAIRSVSKAKAQIDRVYNVMVSQWLAGPKNRFCAVCVHGKAKATECHHKFGRLGKLKLWQPGWIPVCSACHNWIHSNLGLAQKCDYIGPAGTWNNYEAACRHERAILRGRLKELDEALANGMSEWETDGLKFYGRTA